MVRRILEMEPSQRPRERLLEMGPAVLSDAELLAVLMRTGRAGHGAVDEAHSLLKAAAGLIGVARMEISELLERPGFGPAKAATLMAALELGHRLARAELKYVDRLDHPGAASDFLVRRFQGERVEVFGFLSLDSKHAYLGLHELYRGTRNQAPVEPAEIFRRAVLDDAVSIILFHNHPSRDPAPSRDDLRLTERMVGAGNLIGVCVVDHIIVAGKACTSMRSSDPAVFSSGG